MISERSLLERIDDGEKGVGRSAGTDPQKMMDSILNHLRKMLNVRQGSVPTLLDYGLPDFNSLVTRFPEANEEIKRAIKASIEQYEPRLKVVSIEDVPHEEDPLTLRFNITARLVPGERRIPVQFVTNLEPSGKVSIRG